MTWCLWPIVSLDTILGWVILIMRERNKTWIKFSPRRKFMKSENFKKSWTNTRWMKRADRQLNDRNKWIRKLKCCQVFPPTPNTAPFQSHCLLKEQKHDAGSLWVFHLYVFTLQQEKSLTLWLKVQILQETKLVSLTWASCLSTHESAVTRRAEACFKCGTS